jgi:hypothetical protein
MEWIMQSTNPKPNNLALRGFKTNLQNKIKQWISQIFTDACFALSHL